MMKIRFALLLIVIATTLLLPTSTITKAQSPRTVISLDNIDRLQRVSMLGKGYLGEVKWSPDGKTLAVGSSTGVWLYDADDLNQAPVWLGSHDFPAMRLTFSPDGKRLVSYNRLTKISVWNMESRQLEREIELPNQVDVRASALGFSTSYIFDVSFAPNGQIRVASTLPYQLGFHIWDALTGKDILIEQGKDKNYLVSFGSVDYSPDGETAIIGYQERFNSPSEIQLCSLKTGKQLTIQTDATTPINDAVYSLDSKYIAIGSGNPPSDYADMDYDNYARLYDAQTGKLLAVSEGHRLWVGKIAFSPNGKLLATGSGDWTIRLWSVPDGKLVQTINNHKAEITDLSFSPDGKFLASSSGDGTVRVFEVATGKSVSQAGNFSRGNFKILYPLDNQDFAVAGYAFGMNNAQILTVFGTAGTFTIWDAQTGKEIFSQFNLTGTAARDLLSATPKRKTTLDRQILFYYSLDNSKYIFGAWRKDSGQLLRELKVHDTVNESTISPDGTILLTYSEDGVIEVWMVAL